MGAVLGVINTIAMLWQWRRSGPDVVVSLQAGWQLAGNGIVAYPARDFATAIEPPESVQAVVIVNVTNRGRSPIDVLEWWVSVGGGQIGMVSRIPPETVKMATDLGDASALPPLDDMLLYEHNEPCRFRLESHSSQRWVLGMQRVADVAAAMSGAPLIAASVRLGDGKVRKSKESIRPADLRLSAPG